MRIAMMILAAAGAVLGHATAAPSPAEAWGKFGHLTICDLAYRNLTSASRTAMNDLLQAGRGGITVEGRGRMPDRHYTSFNMGCMEEDEIPRAHENDRQRLFGGLHRARDPARTRERAFHQCRSERLHNR